MPSDELLLSLFDVTVFVQLLESSVIIFVIWLLRFLAAQLVNKYVYEAHSRYYWRKTLTYVAGVTAVFFITPLWITHIQSLATFFGLLSAGIAVALREPLTNLFGWIFIMWRRPFEVGDRVQIGEHAGDVVDIRIFEFTLLEIGNWVAADQSTGRVIHVPNSQLFTVVLANYSKGFDYIWNELQIRLTFESNWQKAKTILQEIINEHAAALSSDAAEHVRRASSRYLIVYSKLTPIVYTQVEQNGILLSIRYLCPPRSRRSSEQTIWEHILQTFAEHPDIEFAYPTYRFYQRKVERPEPVILE